MSAIAKSGEVAKMDLHHLRHFVAVAQEKNFGRAALRLGIAQPPLSQSIKRLEDDLGVTLFSRSRRGVALTEAGRTLLPEAERTLMQAEMVRRTANRIAAGETDQLNVSFIGPALYDLLPRIIRDFRAEAPDVALRLWERLTPAAISGLLDGTFDFAFVHPEDDPVAGCAQLVVERCPLVAAIPQHWPIALQETVSLANLAEYPMIVTARADDQSRINAIMHACRGAGFVPHVVQEAMQTHTVAGLVAAEVGVALVMETIGRIGRNGIALRPVLDLPETLNWRIAAVWQTDRLSPSAFKFLEVIQRYTV